MTTVDLPLLPLGRGTDLSAERGVECPGDLPAASDPDLVARARAAKEALGDRVFVLGHHYQRDEVIEFADVTGDSFKLARDAAGRPGGRVHRLLRRPLHGRVGRHPDRPGPEGDPARPRRRLLDGRHGPARARSRTPGTRSPTPASPTRVVPVTYMNSSADIKAFCGRNGGAVCTSSNAEVALEWAFAQKPRRAPRCCSSPTSTSAATPPCCEMGLTLDDCVVWDPHRPNGGLTVEQLRDARMILWKGHCSVHGRFSAEVVDELRATIPGVQILVHPECPHEVVLKADLVGSTEFIIKTIEAAPAGSAWAIGTELNLVKRLAAAHPDKQITFLDKTVCYCSTMNRIDLPHFVWAMESLVAGTVVNQIEVDPETERWALVALQRMLDLPGKSAKD